MYDRPYNHARTKLVEERVMSNDTFYSTKIKVKEAKPNHLYT